MKSIHSEEFMELLNDYAEACEGAPMVVVDAAARALISHIDKHCAEVVGQEGSATARTYQVKPEQDNVEVVSAGDGVQKSSLSPLGAGVAAPVVPKGWKLVPIRPTQAMYDATHECSTYVAFDRFNDDYAAMLAAAPTLPEAAVQEGGSTDDKPIGWLAGVTHDHSEDMFYRLEDAQRECDEYNNYESTLPEVQRAALRVPVPVYGRAAKQAQPVAKEWHQPVAQTEAGKALIRAAQASLATEEYEHFCEINRHDPEAYDRIMCAAKPVDLSKLQRWTTYAHQIANDQWVAQIKHDPDGGLVLYDSVVRALATHPQPAPEGMPVTQEPKYGIRDNRLYNRASGEFIPADEPVFIFRARDVHAADALSAYGRMVGDKDHAAAVYVRVNDFRGFAQANPERMKQPDTEPAAPSEGAQAEKCQECHGDGISGELSDGILPDVTYKCPTCNGTGTTPTAAADGATPSKYGSPELQAMIVARAIEKDRAVAPLASSAASIDTPEYQRLLGAAMMAYRDGEDSDRLEAELITLINARIAEARQQGKIEGEYQGHMLGRKEVYAEWDDAKRATPAAASPLVVELPPLPESEQDGDKTTTYFGHPLKYTDRDMHDYARAAVALAVKGE